MSSDATESPASNGTPDTPRRGILRNGVGAPAEAAVDEEQPVVRMRNGTTYVNGHQQGDGHAAIQRGLEALAEQELDQNMEEIKKLDTQLDHFHKYLDTFEKKNNELTERLESVLKAQREERTKRRSSFIQRQQEYEAEQNSFDSQVHNMLSRCAQSRRSVPVFDSVQQADDNRRARIAGDTISPQDERMDTP